MSSALPLLNLKYPLDYFKFTIGIIFYFIKKNPAEFFFAGFFIYSFLKISTYGLLYLTILTCPSLSIILTKYRQFLFI